jgi:hypothetical protein
MAFSFGSNDMNTWSRFADFIDQNGLLQTYRQVQKFNHPPFMGLMAVALNDFATWSGIPFRLCWKVPPLMGDLFAMSLLWRHFAPRGALLAAASVAVFSCNPVSIMVTAFHGNTDSLLAVLVLYAAILHGRFQLFGAGLAIAGAVNVKVVALILVPGYLVLCTTPALALRFAAGFVLGCVPILATALMVPAAFYRNVFAYDSQIRPWGVNAWALYCQGYDPELYRLVTVEYRAVGKQIIVALSLALALAGRLRRWNAIKLGAATMGLFLFVTPGFGIQYLVWLVPLLAASSLRYSAWWGLLAGTFALLTYNSFLGDEWPLRSHHRLVTGEPTDMVGVLAWILLGCYLYAELVPAFGGRSASTTLQREAGVSAEEPAVAGPKKP